MKYTLNFYNAFRYVTLACGLEACSGVITPSDSGQLETTVPDGSADTDAGADSGTVDVMQDEGTDAPSVTPLAMWALPRTGPNEFQLPWPSDLTLDNRGFADFRYIPNRTSNGALSDMSRVLSGRIAGFSTVGAVYFRFNVPIDMTSLPANAQSSIAATSTVQIIDIATGQRVPAQYYFRERATRYWPANTLAVAPAFGFPLESAKRYAVVVTNGLRASSGQTFQRDQDLNDVLATTGGDSSVETARTLHQPFVTAVEQAGIPRANVLSIAAFTTQDCTGETFRAIDAVRSLPAEYNPDFVDITRGNQRNGYQIYTGHYGPSPLFQTGQSPYNELGSGDFELNGQGVPVVQARQNIAFALTIPTGTAPQGGWPIVIYAHGTGGDAMSFISDGTAAGLARQGVAVIGFDQVFNGERAAPGVDPAFAFFNITNPIAARTNNRQAAIDLAQLGRLVRRVAVPAATSHTGADIRFNPSRVSFFGHSQGGLNGPLWLAADNDNNGPGAGVLSGAGGTLVITIMQRDEGRLRTLVGAALGISASGLDEIQSFHPVLTLVQTGADVADPVNYARYIIRQPRAGHAPRHVYLTQGYVDTYTPPDSTSALAMAMGLQLINPVLHSVTDYPLVGIAQGMLPFQGNLASGQATGGWQQFDSVAGSNGHFVIFDIQSAMDRASRFLSTWGASQSLPAITQN